MSRSVRSWLTRRIRSSRIVSGMTLFAHLNKGIVMIRLRPFLLVCAVMLVAQGSQAEVPEVDNHAPETALPVGKWHVEFTNGVIEACIIGNGGTAVVDEPRRRSRGTVAARGGSILLTFNDDRVERWTSVGK